MSQEPSADTIWSRLGSFRSGFSAQLVVIATIFILSFATFYILFQASTSIEYIREIIAALIATILTVTITTMLLKAQTSSEEVKERNVEVFRKKVEIYEQFLRVANECLEDGTLDEQETRQLRRFTYNLSLFSDEETIHTVALFQLNLETVGPLTGSDLAAVQNLIGSGFANREQFRALGTAYKAFLHDLVSSLSGRAGGRRRRAGALDLTVDEIEGVTDRIAAKISSSSGIEYSAELIYPTEAAFDRVVLELFAAVDGLQSTKRKAAQSALGQLGFEEEEFTMGDGSEETLVLKRYDLVCSRKPDGELNGLLQPDTGDQPGTDIAKIEKSQT